METGILSLLSFVEDVKERVHLADYATSCDFVQFGDTYIGYSPFDDRSHDNYLDRRLVVRGDKYYCLETGASGDIIDYVMHERNLSFREAVSTLASVAGMDMPDIEGEIEERKRINAHKDKLYRLMRDTMLHYFNNLRDPRAKIAVDYLEGRGFDNVLTTDREGRVKITNETVCTFALGYSLDDKALVDSMLEKGYTIEEMDECGLVYVKGGKAYDVMAGRLIIPILNRHGKVIAFSGRIFEAKGHQKYRNTGNTILFRKKNELYGANNLSALAHNGKLSEIYVVEGYMDVISLYKEGVRNVVASMGTALTSDHANILKDYQATVYLTYDGDSAGQDAIRRGVDVLYAEGVEARVITLPGGQDPDEIIKAHGLMYFLDLKHSSRNMIQYKLDDLATGYNLDEADDKGDYAVKAIDLLLTYASKVEAEEYIERISAKSGISTDVLRQEMYLSTTTKMNNGDALETKTLSTREQGLVFIMYEMLNYKKNRNIAVFLANKEEDIAYNYMRLMRESASEEEFSELLSSDIARHISLLRNMDREELMRASDDSYLRLTSDLVSDINKTLMTSFASESNIENKYIINECVMCIARKMMELKRSQLKK